MVYGTSSDIIISDSQTTCDYEPETWQTGTSSDATTLNMPIRKEYLLNPNYVTNYETNYKIDNIITYKPENWKIKLLNNSISSTGGFLNINDGTNYTIDTSDYTIQWRWGHRGLTQNIKTSRSERFHKQRNSEPELRARALLRELISPEKYQRYLKTGHLMVQGRSGLMYRIRGDEQMTRVYIVDVDGKYHHLEDLCVVFKDNGLPYTDAVIMRMMLIENDEFAFRSKANVFSSQRRAIA